MSRNKSVFLIVLICVFVATASALVWKTHLFRSKQYSLKYMLRAADFVAITQYGKSQDGTLVSDCGLAVLIKSKNPEIYSLLKGSSGFHSVSPSGSADYVVYLQSYKDSRHDESYWYFGNTGELGHKHEWCYVPKALQIWMKTLPKPHHGKYRITRAPYYDIVQGAR